MNYDQHKSAAKAKLNDLVKDVSPAEKELSKSEYAYFQDPQLVLKYSSTIQDINERKKYASLIFGMVVVWLVVILSIIIFTGIGSLTISDTVMLALIGSTTVNVTAFFVIVTKYLFPNGKEIQ